MRLTDEGRSQNTAHDLPKRVRAGITRLPRASSARPCTSYAPPDAESCSAIARSQGASRRSHGLLCMWDMREPWQQTADGLHRLSGSRTHKQMVEEAGREQLAGNSISAQRQPRQLAQAADLAMSRTVLFQDMSAAHDLLQLCGHDRLCPCTWERWRRLASSPCSVLTTSLATMAAAVVGLCRPSSPADSTGSACHHCHSS